MSATTPMLLLLGLLTLSLIHILSVWFSREGVQRKRPLAKLQVNRLYVIRLFQIRIRLAPPDAHNR